MLLHCVYRIEDLLRRVILDVDSGIDDVIAILVALRSSNICVVGISTVNGNVNPNIGMEHRVGYSIGNNSVTSSK